MQQGGISKIYLFLTRRNSLDSDQCCAEMAESFILSWGVVSQLRYQCTFVHVPNSVYARNINCSFHSLV